MKHLIDSDDIAATFTASLVIIFEKAGKKLTKEKVKTLYESQKKIYSSGRLVNAKLFEKTLKDEKTESIHSGEAER